MGRRGDKMFEGEGGAGVPHWQRGTRLNSGDILVGEVREERHSVTSRDTAGREAPGVRATQDSEFGEGG